MPHSPNKFIIAGAAVAALLSAGCVREESAPPRRIATIGVRDIVVTATAAGSVAPVATVEVKSQASGEIVEVLVDDGSVVKRGQLLARVDPRIPRNAVAQAVADSAVAAAALQNADARMRRADLLFAAHAMTQEELEVTRLDRAQAYASLMRAQRTLEDARIAFVQTEVRAPANGVILARNVEVGSVIASASRDVGGGAVLMRMASLDTVEVQALIDETDVGMVQPGAQVRITVAAFPNRPFDGRVLRIGTEAVAQQNVTHFPVLMRIPNSQGLLKPGMNADVEIRVAEARGVLAVPNAALRNIDELRPAIEMLGLTEAWLERQLDDPEASDADYAVFRTHNDTIDLAPVRTGLTDYDYSVVLDGLTRGDSVIILPTAGFIAEQAERQEWIDRRVGGNPLGGGQAGQAGRGSDRGGGRAGGGRGARGGGRN